MKLSFNMDFDSHILLMQLTTLIASIPVAPKGHTNNTLYDIQFIPERQLLIVSGDPGVLIYKWSDIQQHISQNNNGHSGTLTVKLDPITSFHPHPSPSDIIEINSTSYDMDNGVLYAASGDGFGCYQWDLERQQLLGTFGGGSRDGHTDYLHVVKIVDGGVITGGEDGKMVSFCVNSNMFGAIATLMHLLYFQTGLLERQRKEANPTIRHTKYNGK